MRKMKEYNFKASDNNGEMLVGLGFSFSFMGVAGLILMLRLVLFPKIKYSSYVNNIYLEKFLIVVPALIITAYVMKLIKVRLGENLISQKILFGLIIKDYLYLF